MALSNTETRHSRQKKDILATCEQMSGPQKTLESMRETVQGLPPRPLTTGLKFVCRCSVETGMFLHNVISLTFSVQLLFLSWCSSFLIQ